MRESLLAVIKNCLTTLGYNLSDAEYSKLLNDIMQELDKPAAKPAESEEEPKEEETAADEAGSSAEPTSEEPEMPMSWKKKKRR